MSVLCCTVAGAYGSGQTGHGQHHQQPQQHYQQLQQHQMSYNTAAGVASGTAQTQAYGQQSAYTQPTGGYGQQPQQPQQQQQQQANTGYAQTNTAYMQVQHHALHCTQVAYR